MHRALREVVRRNPHSDIPVSIGVRGGVVVHIVACRLVGVEVTGVRREVSDLQFWRKIRVCP